MFDRIQRRAERRFALLFSPGAAVALQALVGLVLVGLAGLGQRLAPVTTTYSQSLTKLPSLARFDRSARATMSARSARRPSSDSRAAAMCVGP